MTPIWKADILPFSSIDDHLWQITRAAVYFFIKFTYAQLFIVISVQAFWGLLADKVTKRKRRWYKTQRFT
ncbi:hypothetical protein NST23_25940 [Brevibacillus sp. FSL K6-0770]|uniref:hypothetical protein n=1 Tax=Brevibacillus sp. FSL K6-0770 TaxID=2954673 RepID=UPI0030F62DED